jgi:hypothetical protein
MCLKTKTMRYVIILSVISCFSLSFAQNNYSHFPDSNAVWSIWDRKITVNGDTIINGLQYKKYYNADSNFSNPFYLAALREDVITQKVFAFFPNYNSERILYDFSAIIGDTVESQSFSVEMNSDNQPLAFKVLEVDSISILGNYHKRLKVKSLCESQPIEDYWVAGIGSVSAGLFDAGMYGFCGAICFSAPPVLICYERDGNLLFDNPSYDNCIEYPLGTTELQLEIGVSIYPNPTSDIVTITSKEPIDNYSIYTTHNQLILSKNNSTNFVEVSFANLPSGVYFLKINSSKGSILKKISKN